MNPMTNNNLIVILVVILLLALDDPAMSQTRAQGPWWPHPLWGASDQSGASNWNTPEKILKALTLVKMGKVYELGHAYERGMPMVGHRSYNIFIPSFPTYGPSGEGKAVFNDEFIAAEIGQVGTQFDGPGHVGNQMKMADGSVTEVFYNGFTTTEMKDPYGLKSLGVENVKPYITKGVLIDLAGYKKTEMLPVNYEVTLEDVRNTLKTQGLTEADIEPGDALLFNFGWWRHWPKQFIIDGGAPYINAEVVEWIIGKQASMVGSDTNLDGPQALVHTELTMKNGIFNLEYMTFESLLPEKAWKFLFIFTPLRLKGATGSPGRPLAVR